MKKIPSIINKKSKVSSSFPSISSLLRKNHKKNIQLYLIAFAVGVVAIIVGSYIYAIASIPPVDLSDVEVPASKTRKEKEPHSSSSTSRGSKKSKKQTTLSKEEEEIENTKIDQLLEKKLITPIEEGWITITKDVLPVKKLHSSFTKRQKQFEELITRHHPSLLLDSTILQKWPIFQLDLLTKAQKNISLENCRYQWLSPVFVLGQEREKGGMLGSAHDLPLVYINITLLQFLQSTFQEKIWLYWTAELEIFEQLIESNATIDHHDFSSSSSSSSSSSKLAAKKKKSSGWEYFIIQEKNLRITNEEDQKERNSKFKMKNNNNTVPSAEHNDENINDVNEANEVEEEEYDLDFWRPMIWLSHPGVIAQAHYDTQHNIFIQLQGMKRFYLFPPSTNLYSFPNIHYSYRQSQLPFHLPRNSSTIHHAFPAIHPSNTSAYEVLLKPGDILYIPPYWTHTVESLSFSMSLSILSPSTTEAALSEIYWQKVPFGEFRSSRYDRMRVISLFFQYFFDLQRMMMVTQEQKEGKNVLISPLLNLTVVEFANELYETRFAPLDASLLTPVQNLRPNYFCNDLPSPQLAGEEEDENMDIISRRDDAIQKKEVPFQVLLSNHTQSIQFAVWRMSEMLQQFTNQTNTKGTNEQEGKKVDLDNDDDDNYYSVTAKIFLQDYMEQLVRWAVGPQYTAYYLKHCFPILAERNEKIERSS